MKNVLIVPSSVREGRLADVVLGAVQKELPAYSDSLQVEVFDFAKTPLKFFDYPTSPSNPSYAPTDENAIAWTKAVEQADAVIVLAAEYNYSYTAAIKNAIDWLAPSVVENKPFAFIGYGWSGGSKAITNLRALLTGFLKASPIETEANLSFTKELSPEGEIIDAEATAAAIRNVLDALK